MSTTISYKNVTIGTVDNQTKRLTTQGKYLEADIILTDETTGAGAVWQDQDGFIVLDDGDPGANAFIQIENLPNGGQHYIINSARLTGNVEYGTFTVTSDIALADSGTTINIGFSGQPDSIFVWMDKDSFEELGSWVNNTHYKFALIKNDSTILGTFPYQRYSASEDIQPIIANSPYIRYTSPNVNTTTDSSNPVGYSVSGGLSFYSRNVGVDAINSDGTITFTRHSTAASYIKAGTYHYYAVTGGMYGWLI